MIAFGTVFPCTLSIEEDFYTPFFYVTSEFCVGLFESVYSICTIALYTNTSIHIHPPALIRSRDRTVMSEIIFF